MDRRDALKTLGFFGAAAAMPGLLSASPTSQADWKAVLKENQVRRGHLPEWFDDVVERLQCPRFVDIQPSVLATASSVFYEKPGSGRKCDFVSMRRNLNQYNPLATEIDRKLLQGMRVSAASRVYAAELRSRNRKWACEVLEHLTLRMEQIILAKSSCAVTTIVADPETCDLYEAGDPSFVPGEGIGMGLEIVRRGVWKERIDILCDPLYPSRGALLIGALPAGESDPSMRHGLVWAPHLLSDGSKFRVEGIKAVDSSRYGVVHPDYSKRLTY